MEVKQPVSTTLHILADLQNVVGWRLVLNYMQTSPTHYYLESSVQVAYMETHPKIKTSPFILDIDFENVHHLNIMLACQF